MLWLLWSMFYDDGSLQDFASAKGEGQSLIAVLFEELGFPLKEAKRQLMNHACDFLGLTHLLKQCFVHGKVHFWPRPRLIEKATNMAQTALNEKFLLPTVAGKLNGMLTFTETGTFGRIGKAVTRPLRQREHHDKPPWQTSNAIERALDMLLVFFKTEPQRELCISRSSNPPLLVASDARFDSGSVSGAYLVVDTITGARWGAVMTFGIEDLECFGFTCDDIAQGANPIAPCEAAMVAVAALELAAHRHGRDVLHLVDNTAALFSFIKGGSNQAAIDRCCHIVHMSIFHLRSNIWFEYVASCDNWSDDASRLLLADPFSAGLGFKLVETSMPR